MRPHAIDTVVTDIDQKIGAIWSKHCITPYQDAILIGDNLFFLRSDGTVTSAMNVDLIEEFGNEA